MELLKRKMWKVADGTVSNTHIINTPIYLSGAMACFISHGLDICVEEMREILRIWHHVGGY